MNRTMWIQEISAEEFGEHIGDKDFFRVYGNPVLIRSDTGSLCVCMSIELYERLTGIDTSEMINTDELSEEKEGHTNNEESNICVEVDTNVKEEAERILSDLGIPVSTAIEMLYRQVIMRKGIPFKIKEGNNGL